MMELGPQSHSQGGLLVRGSIYGPSGVYTSTQKREREREREGGGTTLTLEYMPLSVLRVGLPFNHKRTPRDSSSKSNAFNFGSKGKQVAGQA